VLLKHQVAAWAPALGGALLVAAWRGGWPDDAGERAHSAAGGARAALRRFAAIVPPLAALVAGFSLPLALTWLVFDRWGAADDLVYWTIEGNASYVANPIPFSEALERAASFGLPWAIVTAPLWWGAWRARRTHEPYRAALLALLLAATLVAVCLGWRFFPHYFIQFYVPLVLAAAPWLGLLLARPLDRGGVRFVAWTAGALVLSLAINAALYFGPRRVYRETDPVYGAVAERLRRDPCSSAGSLFVWGYAPVFYYKARLPAASRFVVLAPARLTTYLSGNLASVRGDIPSGNIVSEEHWDLLMQDLEARRATFVLDTAPAGIQRWNRYPIRKYPRLDRYLRERFELVDSVDGVAIYRRRGCEGTGGQRPAEE
jgi:hypothetical protein